MTAKQIKRVRRDPYQNAPVGPSGTELHVTTNDGWFYLFRRLTDNEPFELIQKRRPDGSTSTDDIVPKPVLSYFEDRAGDELADANTMVSANE